MSSPPGFVTSRARRVVAVKLTVVRAAVVAAGAAVWVALWLLWVPWWLVAAAALAACEQSGREVAGFALGRDAFRRRAVMQVPTSVRRHVDELAPRFGLWRRRVDVVVVELGEGPARDLPLAAATSGVCGPLLIVDDDLAVKAKRAAPGSLEDREVRAVLAHELAHVASMDVVVGAAERFARANVVFATAAAAAAAVLGWVSPWVVLLSAPAWVATRLVQRWVSRAVELSADRRAARLGGDPAALISALERDFPSQPRGWRSWFDTHPPTTRRAARLRQLLR